MEQVEGFRPGQRTGSLEQPGGDTRRMMILQNRGYPRRSDWLSTAGRQFEGEYQMGDV
jgi:hypothetical protein